MSLAEIPVELIRRSRDGEDEALNELIVEVSPDVRRLVYNQVRDVDETDEILQEVMIRLIRHLHKIKDIGKFSAWLMRMVMNQCYTHLRKRSRRNLFYSFDEAIEVEDENAIWPLAKSESPRKMALCRQVRDEINEAILKLPERQRAAFTLFQLQGCSIREIAETLGSSQGAVKFNIHQARQKLKKSLSHYWDGRSVRLAGEEI